MKEQSKSSKRELSNEEIANLCDGEFKARVIKYSQNWLSLAKKMKEQIKDTPNEIKQNIQGTQQWREGNQDSKQWFGTKGKNKYPMGTEWINKNSKMWRESYKPLGQTETLRYLNYRGARRKRTAARNWKLIWTNNEGKLPQSGEGNRLPGSPGSSESPKEVGPKEEHTKAHHH